MCREVLHPEEIFECVCALTELVLKKKRAWLAQLRYRDIFRAIGILFKGAICISKYLNAIKR